MAKLSISKTGKNKGGRPRVNAVPVMVRLPPEKLEKVDNWREGQEGRPGRPEAIRRLIDRGLPK